MKHKDDYCIFHIGTPKSPAAVLVLGDGEIVLSPKISAKLPGKEQEKLIQAVSEAYSILYKNLNIFNKNSNEPLRAVKENL